MLVAVEECIKERTPLDCKLWVICWHEERLKCLPHRSTKDDGNIFGRFNVSDLERGLTLEQWSSVAKKMICFFRIKIPKDETLYMETPKCPDHPKL